MIIAILVQEKTVFFKKTVLKKFVKFIGKQMCWSPLSGCRDEDLLKRESGIGTFL